MRFYKIVDKVLSCINFDFWQVTQGVLVWGTFNFTEFLKTLDQLRVNVLLWPIQNDVGMEMKTLKYLPQKFHFFENGHVL